MTIEEIQKKNINELKIIMFDMSEELNRLQQTYKIIREIFQKKLEDNQIATETIKNGKQ